MIRDRLKEIGSAVAEFCLPSFCLHCSSRDLMTGQLLCISCSQIMTLLPPVGRCTCCFTDGIGATRCRECDNSPPPFDHLAAAVDYLGPAVSLIRKYKYGGMRWLNRGMAGLLAVQMQELKWNYPDVLVPVPISWPRRIMRGYNQSHLLAEELGKLLDVPVNNCLRKDPEVLPQASMERENRLKLQAGHFFLTKNQKLEHGQRILLVDDVITTGSTARACCEKLLETRPAEINFLAVAITP